VSKDFDTTLSDALDLAAGASQTTGASAARIRGRQRTVRRRIIVTTASVALVAVGATVAFKAISSSDGGSPRMTAASPSATADASVTALPRPVTTPSESPSSSPTGSPSAPATGSTAASEHWLTPAQIPFDNAMNWTAGSPNSCNGSMVFLPIYPGGCSEHNAPRDAHAALKMDTVIFNSTGVPTGNGAWAPPAADQAFYTYASAAAAQSSFQYITDSFLKVDSQLAVATDAITKRPLISTTTVTAHMSGSMAIDHKLRDDNGTPGMLNGNGSGSSDIHFFFAVKGDIVEVLEIQGGPSISDSSNDAAILQTVINALG
jgi:hypothetical protein